LAIAILARYTSGGQFRAGNTSTVSERELFAFPGIWQCRTGPVKKEGPDVELDVYSFMTTAPNALTVSINHVRMPVLLSGDDKSDTWLSRTAAESFALARNFDPAKVRVVQSGLEKKDLLAA
jgi:putative SOS response-associated peptidase YedK